jgi:hypothetical protein
MQYPTAISTRAALTFWYRSVRPNESVPSGAWIKRRGSGKPLLSASAMNDVLTHCLSSHGLPTRSRAVSEFMVGLEKMKAKAGEISQSARALSSDDMHRLYNLCMKPDASSAEKRWGIVRYVCPCTAHSSIPHADLSNPRRPTYLHGSWCCAARRY